MFTPPPFSYSTQVRGIEITGTVLWCYDNDVEMEITSPYTDIRAGLHVPAFAMAPSNRNLDNDGKISEKGFRTIANCLVSAYEEAKFLLTNKDILFSRIIETEPERIELAERLKVKKSEFHEQKSIQKSRYRENRSSQVQYMEFLRTFRIEIEALETGISDSYRKIFAGFPGHHVSYGTEKQAIRFVMKHNSD